VGATIRNQLIVQFQIVESDSFDDFITIEDTLHQAFSQNNHAIVDGHDIGQGRFNIYIFPRGAWGPVTERVHALLKLKGWLNRAVIAKRLKSEKYKVIWPEEHVAEFEL
jgi:hypothetical protein